MPYIFITFIMLGCLTFVSKSGQVLIFVTLRVPSYFSISDLIYMSLKFDLNVYIISSDFTSLFTS